MLYLLWLMQDLDSNNVLSVAPLALLLLYFPTNHFHFSSHLNLHTGSPQL